MTGQLIEFEAWPKIPRLKKDMIVTEKIDGTNAAVLIRTVRPEDFGGMNPAGPQLTIGGPGGYTAAVVHLEGKTYLVAAQSRKRLITPDSDNFGFAKWVWDNAADLVRLLGEGRHFGEWWGSGIQRGYGLTNGEKRFSLFNVNRYQYVKGLFHQIDLVPELYRGPFSTTKVSQVLGHLSREGSQAAPGFMRPEGVIVYHVGAGSVFKAFVDPEDEAAPKGLRE